jgi:hypothetical protein
MTERWRKVRRGPGYKVSSNGRVKSVDRILSDGRAAGGVMLTPWLDDDGYPTVTINGEDVPVHLLVLEQFHGPRPYGTEGCHGPGGRQDNRASELRWDTHRENVRDTWRDREGRGRRERGGKGKEGRKGEFRTRQLAVRTSRTGDLG